MEKKFLLKVFETENYTYLVFITETKVWYVKRISNSSPLEIKYANEKYNPGKNINDALTNPESLVYNYYHEI